MAPQLWFGSMSERSKRRQRGHLASSYGADHVAEFLPRKWWTGPAMIMLRVFPPANTFWRSSQHAQAQPGPPGGAEVATEGKLFLWNRLGRENFLGRLGMRADDQGRVSFLQSPTR
jgi:hypothetical protein